MPPSSDPITLLQVRVKPRARRAGAVGWHGAALEVAVKSAPEQGRANVELLSLVANLLDLPRRQVEVASGAASQDKTLRITGLDASEVRLRIDAALAGE